MDERNEAIILAALYTVEAVIVLAVVALVLVLIDR